MADVVPTQTNNEWDPHAEKEFARLNQTIARGLPTRLAVVRRVSVALAAAVAAGAKKGAK